MLRLLSILAISASASLSILPRSALSLPKDYQLSAISCWPETENYIRAAILQDAASLRMKINGNYEVIDAKSNKVLTQGKYLNTTVTAYKYGIFLDNIQAKTDRLLIVPCASCEVTVNGRRFRGNIQFIKRDDSHLLVVNDIRLEDYIKGILYHEVSHYWPYEALKAQAVVCRTYAAYQMQENKSRDYDVTSDVYSQVYGGKTSELYRTNKAVDDTAGEILTYKGKLFPAYFHASCGGHTEAASRLWDIDTVPLSGVACGFCNDSPHFKWHYVLSLKEIADKLRNSGYKTDAIQNINILGIDESGRVINLRITSNNKDMNISAKDFRQALGPNIIRSTNFKIEIVEDDAVFNGLGWGHGVGLCQWGAYFMAKNGRRYAEILKYYYPGAQITTPN